MNCPAHVLRHIRECDRMYEGVYGKPDQSPETSVCRMLLERGVELRQNDLPDICIRECERWSLKAPGG
jgi:hypothetical protein